MLALLLHAGGDAFAIPAADVLEVVPRVALLPLAGAPDWIAGMMRLRGAIVPVVDRVQRGHGRSLGILAERVTTTAPVAEDDAYRGLALPGAPYLGVVAIAEDTMVQVLRPRALLPPEVEETLFAEAHP
jgi:chemotaxis-related protein WspB